MQLSSLTSTFPFIDYTIVLPKEKPVSPYLQDTAIDENKLSKILNSNLKLPLWVDFSEITNDAANYPGQLDLLGHSNEPVLLMISEDAATVFLFKFKKHEAHEDIYYGRDQKNLIEKCLILELSKFDKQLPSENDNFEKYFQICKNQIVKINQLNDELTKLKLEAEKFYTRLFNYFLKDKIKPGSTISLSDSTLEYLKSSDLAFSEIETLAKESYKIAVELSSSPTDIRIKRYFLPQQVENELNKIVLTDNKPEILKSNDDTKPIKKEPIKLKSNPTNSKLEKTIQLLDRYELAVKKLMEDKLPVMGKNIANVCSPKISAPALTDSINKHKERITECFKQYPDKWPLLKANYLPVQKLAY